MRELHVGAERSRTTAAVALCQQRLRLAEDNVRCASEMLRRAIRTAQDAESELVDATRRLDTMGARTIKPAESWSEHRARRQRAPVFGPGG